MKKYPFKFLDAYSREDSGIFFGRDEEIDALYEMVFQSSILLVYGASGTGKTSLIQCGLANKFQSHDWLALPIRRGSNINASFEKTLADAGGNVAETEDMDWLKEVMEEKEGITLNKTLSLLEKSFKAIYLNSFRPIYLIFDQFEELFILGNKEEQEQFIETVKEILQVEQPVKMIFSIREEYLGHLNAFERAIPQLLRKKLRVESMNLDKVRQVIVGATSYENSNVHLQNGETHAISERIFDKIKGDDKTLTIQLPYLQVFLDKFYLDITKDETRHAEAVFTTAALSKIGDIGDVLRNFLEEQVTAISKKLSVHHADLTIETVWKILSPFATLEGTKEPINKMNLYDRLPDFDRSMIDDTVEAFINSRILRYADETDNYEIAHDSLAKRIAEKRSDEEIALLEIKRLIKSQTAMKESARELFSEKQLNFIEPYLAKINLALEEQALIQQSHEAVAKQKVTEKVQQEAEKQRLLERQQLLEKNQRSQKRFIRWIAAALVLMIGLAVWAFDQQQNAKANASSAIRNEKKAQSALEENKKQQADSKARELKAFGDSYLLLGDTIFACDSYRKGLAALDSLPKSTKASLLVFTELTDLKRKLKCE
ncbi:MAG: AAA family ATPase [Ginsengibacter sp.]